MKKLSFIFIISILLLSSCATTNPSDNAEMVYTPEFIPVEHIKEVSTPIEEVFVGETIIDIPFFEEDVEVIEELPLAQIIEEEAIVAEEEPIEILSLDKEYIKFNYTSNLSLDYLPEENEKLYLVALNEVPPSEFDYISIKTYLAKDIISNSNFETELNQLSAVEIRDIIEEQRAILAQNPSYLSLLSYDVVNISNLFSVYYSNELASDDERVIVENYYIQNNDVIHEIIISYRESKASFWRDNANLVLSTVQFMNLYEEELVAEEVIEAEIEETPIVEKPEIAEEKPVVKEEVKETVKQTQRPLQTLTVENDEKESIFDMRFLSLSIAILVLVIGIIFLISRLRKNKKTKEDNVDLDK